MQVADVKWMRMLSERRVAIRVVAFTPDIPDLAYWKAGLDVGQSYPGPVTTE